MGKQHNRRVYAGYYKKYDNSLIYVIAVLKDAGIVESRKEGKNICYYLSPDRSKED